MEKYERKKVVCFKPSIDNRFSEKEIVSRIGLKMKAIPIDKELDDKTYEDIIEKAKFCDIVAFDEAQFFSNRIVDIVKELAYCGKRVLVAGLNLDYRGKTFGPMGDLMVQADEIVYLKAYCSCCGRPAIFTQRLIDDKPAKEGPIELIGDTGAYEPRCRLCFVPPEKA